MTDLLYLSDCNNTMTFTASVTRCESHSIFLNRTYFYPGGGGQPADNGWLEWETGRANVISARKDHGHVRHEIELIEGKLPKEGAAVNGRIDEGRRQQLTRSHTAQHLLSCIALEKYSAHTVGNEVSIKGSTIEFDGALFNTDDIMFLERRANELIETNLPVTKENQPRSEVETEVPEGRARLDLIPESVDPLRIVRIGEFDVCPCGGTHVSELRDIGNIEITDYSITEDDLSVIRFCLYD